MVDFSAPHLLVIDDDNGIRTLLKKFLSNNNYIVSQASNPVEARDLLADIKFDLIILDVMMPKEDGISFAKDIRQNSDVPIIMLTAMGEVESRIEGLETGVDDYLSKPFEPKELLLRIKNILKRVLQSNNQIIKMKTFQFNLASNRLIKNNQIISLTSGESKLLKLLGNNIGKVVSRSEIAKKCDGINERSIDVQIVRLRNKIEEDPKNPIYLQTARGKGYILYSDE